MPNLGDAYVNIIPKAPGIESSIEDILDDAAGGAGEKAGQTAGKGLAGGIAKTLLTGTAAVSAAVVGVGKMLLSGSAEVAAYGDSIDKMSQKMGLSRTAYQEWDAIMQHSGTSIASMQASMKTLANAVESGNGAFERIGLNMEDVASMSNEDLFAATIAGLQNVENETERTYLAGQLLGRGATELGALLNTSAEDTEAMRQRVHELGGVMSDEAVLAGARFQDSMQDMTTALSGIKRSIEAQFMPGIADMMDGFTSLIVGEADAENKISAGLDNILNTAETAGAQAFSIAGTLLPQLVAVLTAHLPQMIEGGTQLIMALASGVLNALPQITSAGLQILGTLLSGISQALPQLITTSSALIPVIVNALISAAPQLLMAGIQILTAVVSGIGQALPDLIAAATGLIPTICTTIIANLPQILQAGAALLLELLTGIIQAIPQLLTFVPELFSQTVAAFAQIDWAKLGSQLIDGIIQGVLSAASRLWDAVRNAVQGALNAGRAEAEVGSPSRLFARELGQWIPSGAAVGVEENTETFRTSVRRMVNIAAADHSRFTLSGITAAQPVNKAFGFDYERLAAAMADRPICIEGDTAKIFKVVRKANTMRTKATNWNALGAKT